MGSTRHKLPIPVIKSALAIYLQLKQRLPSACIPSLAFLTVTHSRAGHCDATCIPQRLSCSRKPLSGLVFGLPGRAGFPEVLILLLRLSKTKRHSAATQVDSLLNQAPPESGYGGCSEAGDRRSAGSGTVVSKFLPVQETNRR